MCARQFPASAMISLMGLVAIRLAMNLLMGLVAIWLDIKTSDNLLSYFYLLDWAEAFA